MAAVLCLDFDDTMVLDNTARQIFDRFAAPQWREFESEYRAGRISVEQFNARAFATIGAPRDELYDFALEVTRPRSGLLELLDWALWHDWLPVVVSNGFDFYVDALLDKLGVDRVTRHAGRTRFEYQWRCTYYSPRGIEIEEGFKLAYASAFRGMGDFVAYVGDGASDIPAARLAPVVFARDALLVALQDGHERLYPFETLDDIRTVLDRESAAWF